MVQKFFQVDSLELLGPLGSLIMSIVAECSASAAPVIGHIKDGVSAIGEWIDVGVGIYHKESISQCSYSIEMGDPAAAFAALEKLLPTRLTTPRSALASLPVPLSGRPGFCSPTAAPSAARLSGR